MRTYTEGLHKEDNQCAHAYRISIMLTQVSVGLRCDPFQSSVENESHGEVRTCDNRTPFSAVEMTKPTNR
jgi:hypothetical protein